MTAVEKKVIPFPQPPVRRRDYELAFLPAALEITETPPSPTRRAVGLTIITLFCLTLAWASLGTTDIVANAPGKIVPSGRTKLIQPFETGVVRAIHVESRRGAIAWAVRQRFVSSPRSSNRTGQAMASRSRTRPQAFALGKL